MRRNVFLPLLLTAALLVPPHPGAAQEASHAMGGLPLLFGFFLQCIVLVVLIVWFLAKGDERSVWALRFFSLLTPLLGLAAGSGAWLFFIPGVVGGLVSLVRRS